jgi:3-hydroxyisobutyrate dehydrogenase-like beta-hydroxyacid dehydrogenase
MEQVNVMTDGSMAKPRLGFIGIGNMGGRVARRLLTAGYPLGIYSRHPDSAHALVDLGARVYASPRLLADNSDVVLTMVPDDSALERVVLGADGVLSGIREGATIIDLSSVHPSTSRSIATAAAQRSVSVLDAPVSGSTPQAEAGTLVVFVGGERDIYESCRPIFEAISNASFFMGPSGAGATMKLVVNDLLGVGMQALAEALTLGQRAGLDKDLLIDVLQQTSVLTAGQKAKLQNARNDAYPIQFALRLMWKDFGNVMRLAQEYQVPLPATAAAHQISTIAQRRGVDEDFSAVIRTMEELAELPQAQSAQRATDRAG